MKTRWRTIVVSGVQWKYFVGSTWMKFKGPQQFIEACHVVKGIASSDFERGQWKRTSDGAVLPSEVARYLQQRLPPG